MFCKVLNLSIITVFILCGCDYNRQTKYHDPNLFLQKKDYLSLTKNHHAQTKKIKKKKKTTKIVLHKDFYKPISITSSENVPIKEILFAIAKQANINVLIDPKIIGNSSINAHQIPVVNIIMEICSINNLRYEIKNNILKISIDAPYLKNYNLQFLSLTRINKNKLSITTDVFSTMDQSASNDENGSNTLLTTETKIDFWNEVEQNLKNIIPQQNNSYFTINKQAGIITINATQKKQKQIEEYLKCLKTSIDKQVLIEAKIIEVNLKDEFQSGINWDILKYNFITKGNLGSISSNISDGIQTPEQNIFNLGHTTKKFNSLISVLNHFGTVRTLSNPRITVLNNNSAILKVAENLVYFKLHYTKDYKRVSGSDKIEDEVRYSSDIKTVPIGLMMYVHPTIRSDGKIIMTIRPTISKIIHYKQDPAVTIAANTPLESKIPEIQIRELDSVLSMDSGETVVVGGLMEDISKNEQNGIPDTNKVPIIGNLFNSKQNSRKVTELVIFIKATIIENEDSDIQYDSTNISPADQDVYKKFIKDPRAIEFKSSPD